MNHAVRFVIILVLLCAFVNVWSAISPGIPERIDFLRGVFSLELREASRLAAVFSGFMLVLLARGLSRRKRMAWLITVGVLTVSVIAHVVKGLDIEEALLGTFAVLTLLVTQREFRAKSDTPSLRDGVRTVILAVVFTAVYGTAGFYLLRHSFDGSFGLMHALEQTMNLFILGPAPLAHSHFAHWFVDSIYAIAVGSFGIALLTLLRPVVIRQPATSDERIRAARVVGAHGRNGLTHFALLDDKHFYFHPSGESMVSFVVTQGIGLALGDPIGPQALQKETIVGFIAHCRAHDWKPVFYQTEQQYVYDELGMTTLPIGQCALVDLADFTLDGSKNQEIRQVTNKLAKAGITPKFYAAPQNATTIAALREVSDEWLAHKQASEKNFSLGAFSDEYLQESDVQVLETAEGNVVAFANLIPEYPDNIAVIDLMRHRSNIPSGTMLVLLSQLMVEMKARGKKAVDLGLAPLAGLAESDDASSTERILHLLFTRMTEPFNFRGLYAFKKKFHPRFETRYVAYPSPADVVLALDAVRRADSSMSFWREILSELRRRIISRDITV